MKSWLQRWFPLAICLCPALLWPGTGGAADTVVVLTPPDGATLTSSSIHLVYTTRSRLPHHVELDNGPLPRATKTASAGEGGGYVHHVRMWLNEGTHRVQILDRSTQQQVRALTVTRSIPRPSSAVDEPDSRFAFHTAAGEATCQGCHPLPDPTQPPPDANEPVAQQCATCHTDVATGNHIHGPVAVGACYTCHDSTYSPARFTPQPTLATCGSCHVDLVAQMLGGKPYAHGPAAAGACTVCHEPHAGETANLLRDPAPQLCYLCHPDAVPQPLESTLHGKLKCTECHSPHGGATRALTSAPGNRFCSGCHQAVDPAERGHPLMGHPVTTEEGGGRDGRPVRCESCHPPHGTADVSTIDIVTDEKAQRRFCVGCHPT